MATSVRDVTVSDARLLEIVEVANAWALSNGVSIKPGTEGGDKSSVVPAPYALFPSLVPAGILEQAKSTMTEYSRLMHRVAMDHDFLEECLKNVVQVDNFMAGLWNIYLKVREAGVKQPLMLGLFRNDFMMDCLVECAPGDVMKAEQLALKQIEFNSIASSFGGLSQQIGHLHRLTLDLCGQKYSKTEMPENKPASGLSRGLLKAWELYNNPRAVVVFLVSTSERNIIDQRWLELRLYEQNPRVRVLRRTFLDFHEHGTLDADSRLFIGEDEVAVIYMRDGYTADNYTSEKEWSARLMLELSRSVKCPSIQYQLMGSKKIQQELAKPGALERFLGSGGIVDRIRATFADQYSLDLGPEGDKAVELALASPEKFVLKPQREGGGHNLYKACITKFFTEHRTSTERNAYILMQRIFPWQQRNYLIKKGVPFVLSDVVSELGVYGVYIGTVEEEIENYECGHMMRTKISGTDEGGIAAGFAALDTPFVC